MVGVVRAGGTGVNKKGEGVGGVSGGMGGPLRRGEEAAPWREAGVVVWEEVGL